MSTVEMVPVEVAYRDEPCRRTVYGEPTASPQLVIVPSLDHGRLTGGFALLHAPTGLALSGGRPGELREMAARLAHLDWAGVTAENFRTSDIATEAVKVIRECRFTDPDAIELPAHDGWGTDGKGKGMPRAAQPMARHLLQDIQLALEKTHGENAVALDIPDPDSPRGKRMNPEWMLWTYRMVHDFGLAYLLMVLRRIDPQVADSASAFLADAWDAGDSVGEWSWEWHQALIKGETPDLPGVPQLGELFSEVEYTDEHEHCPTCGRS